MRKSKRPTIKDYAFVYVNEAGRVKNITTKKDNDNNNKTDKYIAVIGRIFNDPEGRKDGTLMTTSLIKKYYEKEHKIVTIHENRYHLEDVNIDYAVFEKASSAGIPIIEKFGIGKTYQGDLYIQGKVRGTITKPFKRVIKEFDNCKSIAVLDDGTKCFLNWLKCDRFQRAWIDTYKSKDGLVEREFCLISKLFDLSKENWKHTLVAMPLSEMDLMAMEN